MCVCVEGEGGGGQLLISADSSSILPNMKIIYESNLDGHDINAIRHGLNYAISLWNVNHSIEAERLVAKLVTVSRQVHGLEHKISIDADNLLKQFKELYVFLPGMQIYQALRYENNREICVLQGPIADSRSKHEEEIHHVKAYFVQPQLGCVVICHGLMSASHLNGRLGDTRDFKLDETGTTRLAVYFEK